MNSSKTQHELGYVQGLRLQAVPEQEAAEFLDERNTVIGGLPSHRKATGKEVVEQLQ